MAWLLKGRTFMTAPALMVFFSVTAMNVEINLGGYMNPFRLVAFTCCGAYSGEPPLRLVRCKPFTLVNICSSIMLRLCLPSGIAGCVWQHLVHITKPSFRAPFVNAFSLFSTFITMVEGCVYTPSYIIEHLNVPSERKSWTTNFLLLMFIGK